MNGILKESQKQENEKRKKMKKKWTKKFNCDT